MQDMTSSSVLIVDDDPNVLQTLYGILTFQMKGVTVHLAESGRAALDLIAATDYDAVISDIKMSGMDGLVLMEKIRTIRPGTPVLLITGYDERDLILGALRGGAYDFIRKPIEPGYFLAAVSRAIQMRRQARTIEEQKAALERHADELEQMVQERTRELLDEITERKRTVEALHASEERYRNLVQSARDVIFTLSTDGAITSLNPVFETITGWSQTEWVGKPFAPLIHRDDLPFALQTFHHVLSGEIPGAFELRILSKSGQYLVGEFTVTRTIKDGKVGGVLGIARDITERKQAEEALWQSEQQLRRVLEEREEIARNLHDGIIQQIYALGLGLEECQQLIRENPKLAIRNLGNAIADLNIVLQDVRSHIAGVEPTISSGSQLRAALARLARTMEGSHHLHFRLAVDTMAADRLIGGEANHVLYIAQEAVSNSLRHSRAQKGVVSLQLTDGCVRLEVMDDGVGFDVNLVAGNGLNNMAARAQKLGAKLEIVSQPGRGTRIVLDIPKGVEKVSMEG